MDDSKTNGQGRLDEDNSLRSDIETNRFAAACELHAQFLASASLPEQAVAAMAFNSTLLYRGVNPTQHTLLNQEGMVLLKFLSNSPKRWAKEKANDDHNDNDNKADKYSNTNTGTDEDANQKTA